MIGLVPSGLRVMHDRYASVPMIGLAIVIGFGAADLSARLRAPRWAVGAVAVAVLGACAAQSWVQVGYWRDSLTLFDHTLAVTERNAIVHYYRGNALAEQGDLETARVEFERALEIYPIYPDANDRLGLLYLRHDRGDLALPYLRRAIEARPHWPEAHLDLGEAQWLLGERDRALASFERAVSQAPHWAEAHYWLATARHEQGQPERAADAYREALRIDPTHERARQGLARLRRRTR
jgi:tetratricopeptide (TPR) repeat protein